jgi:hypothetical protein
MFCFCLANLLRPFVLLCIVVLINIQPHHEAPHTEQGETPRLARISEVPGDPDLRH